MFGFFELRVLCKPRLRWLACIHFCLGYLMASVNSLSRNLQVIFNPHQNFSQHVKSPAQLCCSYKRDTSLNLQQCCRELQLSKLSTPLFPLAWNNATIYMSEWFSACMLATGSIEAGCLSCTTHSRYNCGYAAQPFYSISIVAETFHQKHVCCSNIYGSVAFSGERHLWFITVGSQKSHWNYRIKMSIDTSHHSLSTICLSTGGHMLCMLQAYVFLSAGKSISLYCICLCDLVKWSTFWLNDTERLLLILQCIHTQCMFVLSMFWVCRYGNPLSALTITHMDHKIDLIGL